MKLTKNKKILIVGLGLIGGTYAKILSDNAFYVEGIDNDKKVINYAIKNKFIKKGYEKATKDSFNNKDLIIIALYPDIFLKFVKDNKDNFKKGQVLTDVTGIKTYVINKVQNILKDKVEFISAHPMAGGEKPGIKNVDINVFKNANYIVVPTKRNTKENIKMCKDLGKVLGFSKISTLSPKKHDEMIAFLSQLTHVIAISLMTAVWDDNLRLYTGDSFRDLTRIARINEKLWPELFLKNKKALLKEMEKFQKEFNKIKKYLINDDKENIKKMMKLSTKRRNLFDKKV